MEEKIVSKKVVISISSIALILIVGVGAIYLVEKNNDLQIKKENYEYISKNAEYISNNEIELILNEYGNYKQSENYNINTLKQIKDKLIKLNKNSKVEKAISEIEIAEKWHGYYDVVGAPTADGVKINIFKETVGLISSGSNTLECRITKIENDKLEIIAGTDNISVEEIEGKLVIGSNAQDRIHIKRFDNYTKTSSKSSGSSSLGNSNYSNGSSSKKSGSSSSSKSSTYKSNDPADYDSKGNYKPVEEMTQKEVKKELEEILRNRLY